MLRRLSMFALSLIVLNTAYLSAQEESIVKAKPVEETPKAQPATDDKGLRPLSVSVELIGGTKITGTLTDTTSIEMKTSFGAASIPLTETAGIRFASAENATTTIVMLNGDSVTGAMDVKQITVETEWGSASINGQAITSILLVPGVSWAAQEGLNGKRWYLASEEKAATPAPTLPNSNTPTRAPNIPSGTILNQPQGSPSINPSNPNGIGSVRILNSN